MTTSLIVSFIMPKLQRLLAILFSIICLITVFITVSAASKAREERTNHALASDAYQRILQIENLVTALFEAESSQRALLVTQDNVYFLEHQSRRQVVESLLVPFQTNSTSGNDSTAQELVSLTNERLALMDRISQTLQSSGVAAAAESLHAYEGKFLMDQIVAVAAELTANERDGLQARSALSSDHTDQLTWLLASVAALNLILLSGAFLAISNTLRKNSTLMFKAKSTTDDISHINQLSSSLQSCNSLPESVPVLQHYLLRLFPSSSGGIYLLRASRNLLQLSASWGDITGLPDPIEPNDCWALRLGKSHIMPDRRSALPCPHHESDASSICIPLLAQSDIVGLLTLRFENPRLLVESQVRAELVATHTSAALASIILREALQQQSIRDPLTGLFNRRYLEITLERELTRAERSKASLSIMMLDVDHFKSFNDQFGHQAGDHVLKEFGQVLRKQVRGEDIPCRYGGEEFLVAMPNTSADEAKMRAEEIRQQLTNLSLAFQGQPLPRITISVGVAAYPMHASDRDALIHIADNALYSAKKQGRDRVVVG
ncbi:diguanylate cyclase [Pseudohongiella sp. O18]|uniref:diguanylate cyclase n=1 Tax=Pseudohongiella sp. O18 TaxID=2904248 RepID=UPI001F01567E|nr:diguanylate cyclase [Pseudohongiella sp. O18]